MLKPAAPQTPSLVSENYAAELLQDVVDMWCRIFSYLVSFQKRTKGNCWCQAERGGTTEEQTGSLLYPPSL